MSESSMAGSAPSDKRTLLLRATGRAVTLPVLLGFALFFPAGRIDWPSAWALILVYAGGVYLTDVWLIVRHPGLARERLIIPRTAERWDLRIISVVNFLLIGVALPLAGLDRRFAWSPPLPAAVPAAGLILLAAMFVFTAWAMAANGFFSSAIRLQNDRGQTVAAGGPYRFLRHPGYLGMILQFLSIPFGLGTLTTCIPVLVIAGMYVYRTRQEDDFLRKELPGYAEYAGRVRYRLLPGIW
jgi:protein-S-isoprenylcysteine O-methyltransferase Ste14